MMPLPSSSGNDCLSRALAHLALGQRQRSYDEMNDDAIMGAYMRVGPADPHAVDRKRRLQVMAWHRANPIDAFHPALK